MNTNYPSEGEPVHVIDDDPAVRDSIHILCRSIGTQVSRYGSIDEFDQAQIGLTRGCIVLDLRLPRLGGLPGLLHLRQRYPSLPIIVMSAYATTRTVVQAMKGGAVDFFDKPFVPQELLDAIQEAIANSRDGRHAGDLSVRVELLSRAQREVIRRIAFGEREEDIAEALDLHVKSVQRHRRSALEKLNLSKGQEIMLKGLLV